MSKGRPYSELGKVLDELARERHVRGPYRVAHYVREKIGRGPGGSAWSQIFLGESGARPETIQAFTDAFELDEEERARLARVYLFRGERPSRTPAREPSGR